MGFPLQDITIYYDGNVIEDTSKDLRFRRNVNYIADFYHDNLHRYKPPKTGRICVHFNSVKEHDKPIYFGAICSIYGVIDEKKYLEFNKKDQYQYILDLLHENIMIASNLLNWDNEVFETAYKRIIQSDFKFFKEYPAKKSRTRIHSAKPIITKSEVKTQMSFEINSKDDSVKIKVFEKRNWYWFDSAYDIAKSCKWIDKTKFGFISKDNEKYAFFNIESGKLETNMKFRDEE